MLAGTLMRGGAEKQLVYMASALQAAGVRVRVYTLGENEFYERALRDAGLDPVAVGRATSPVLRLVTVARALRRFRPHIVQASTFYVNLYVALASRVSGALDIGAIRCDTVRDSKDEGYWGPALLRAPTALLANSETARNNAARLGIKSAKVHVVGNVIDTSAFDRACRSRAAGRNGAPTVVILVAQLVPAKRVDRFLEALALARRSTPLLKGMVVGDGPDRASLEAQAGRLGLLPDGLRFCGRSNEVPRLMAEADMLALTSDHEGVPNVILEAMAAKLPVVTTPAGDAGVVVADGLTGFVVPFDAVGVLADRLTRLARSPVLRRELGEAAYERVITRYGCAGLADRLVAVYRAAAQQSGRLPLLEQLPSNGSAAALLAGRGAQAR
jgi:glycosyltransferase involved in cell wall biosynthesis